MIHLRAFYLITSIGNENNSSFARSLHLKRQITKDFTFTVPVMFWNSLGECVLILRIVFQRVLISIGNGTVYTYGGWILTKARVVDRAGGRSVRVRASPPLTAD